MDAALRVAQPLEEYAVVLHMPLTYAFGVRLHAWTAARCSRLLDWMPVHQGRQQPKDHPAIPGRSVQLVVGSWELVVLGVRACAWLVMHDRWQAYGHLL